MVDFISVPTYICIELNSHNFIKFYRLLRDNNQLNLFNFIDKCTSQPCEQLFRRFRSMTTINWTSINMSMLEVCQKTKRINVMCKLEQSLSSKGEKCFTFKFRGINFYKFQLKSPKILNTCHKNMKMFL